MVKSIKIWVINREKYKFIFDDWKARYVYHLEGLKWIFVSACRRAIPSCSCTSV